MCKFGSKNAFLALLHFWWRVFTIFQFSVFTENGNFQFLITHIIKLFQIVQVQKGRFKIC